MTVYCRGVRGATTCAANTREEMLAATHELIEQLIAANGITSDEIACAIFTTTPDLNAEYPAVAARAMGWGDTALLCGHEMSVPGGLTQCIRILILWNTQLGASEVRHVYLRGARNLRPDLADALAAFVSAP
ncbi:MAG: chorismate mutase [Candidatus Viridilinea halotolerans]|uniref:chorismate mutase n=1 Tax=Candidatus Viridilinea halotolerans TaxID=2491704 RepID=A0A426TSG9_9CHLR|nr:MAG: chorismate mutase [Candidatus Viridilinea halotolerans]